VKPARAQGNHFRVVDRAPAQRPRPGQQLRHLERLGEVVVGAGVEAGDHVGGAAERGQHQYAGADGPLTQPCDDVQAVDSRQAAIHDNQPVLSSQSEVESALTVGRVIGGIALGGEKVNQHFGKLAIILYEEKSTRAVG
jgi:hypothetical protein